MTHVPSSKVPKRDSGSHRQRWVCEIPRKIGCSRKEILVLLRAPLFLGKWCRVVTYFLYKKIRKINTNYMIKNTSLSLIE